jgi:AcrR family transcriptional regulator
MQKEREPLGREAWTRAAAQALREGGLAEIAVERLAKTLGVTKGSFYSHFETRESLLSAVIIRWEQTELQSLLADEHLLMRPREALRHFMLVAGSADSRKLGRALASLQSNPVIGSSVRRVAAEQLGFIRSRFVALGLSEAKATSAARFLYAVYLGLEELDALTLGPISEAEKAAHVAALLASLAPSACERPSVGDEA